MNSTDLLQYLSKQQMRGFLIDHCMHPDKEHTFNEPKNVEEIKELLTNSSWPIHYESIADAWDKGEHPNAWSGACQRCWIEKEEEVYHTFKSKKAYER